MYLLLSLYRKHGFEPIPRERSGIRQCDQAYALLLVVDP
jgi:hypothetical protein